MRHISSSLPRILSVTFFSILILEGFFSCQSEKNEQEPNRSASEELQSGPGLPEGLPLRVLADKIYLRSEAGVSGEVIAEIERNERVFGTEEVSSFVTQLQKQNQTYEAPWIKVQTVNGLEGWVFASESFLEAEGEHSSFLLEKRMEATFGKKLAESLRIYERSKDSMVTATNLETSLQALRELQSNFQEQINQADKKKSAFWIRKILPELIIHQEEEDQPTDIYLDYRFWRKMAQQTPDSTDNIFIELCISAYPEDSIEYRFPSWFFPTSLNGGHSLLGRGIHLEMFEKINNLSKITPLFKHELNLFKNALIEDIILLNTTYWEEREKAVAELQKILDRNFSFLEPQDQLALQNRLEAFKKAEELGILFNFKSGVY